MEEKLNKFCHDLKNPLTVMRMHLDLLQLENEKNPDLKLKKFIEIMDKEINKMTQIINAGVLE